VALVRVYCGVATAELAPWLTVAVVDDSGRLLDMRHISDDPAGYAQFVSLVADHPVQSCPVAIDHHGHVVAQLLAAAGRPIAVADETAVREVPERFADNTSYEEMQAPPSQRLAVGLARAVAAGALYGTPQNPSWDLDELKPVLAAHAALLTSRNASATALREVLRELYPAALRAYLDPTELIPLTVLEAFPEPSLLSSTQAVQAVVAELTATGLTDATTATNAVTALQVAADEWGGRENAFLAPAVAQSVRHAVTAVRACDAATSALMASLAERLAAYVGAPSHPSAAPVSPAIPRPTSPAEMSPSWGAPVGAARVAAPAGARAYAAPQNGSAPRGSASVAAGLYASGGSTGQAANGNGASHSTGTAQRAGGWEQQFGPAPTSPAPRSYGPETLSFSTDPLTAPLDTTPPAAPNGHGAAEDLRIFSEANSVWFTNSEDDTQVTWLNLSSDEGWRAAAHIADPSVGPDTTAGLPRRVPQANLVPGSVITRGAGRMPRIVRDPRRIAAHTDGYFRGWRRGQEVGGFAIGQRDRGAWEFNREQRARQGAARLS
jgi:hypothetical protein